VSLTPEVGRGAVVAMSRLSLAGSVESAALPALLAATAPDAGGVQFGPNGPGRMAGAPGEQSLYSTLRDPAGAARVWNSP
jgi:hypothetical protein